MSRKTAREEAFKLVFETAFHGGDPKAPLAHYISTQGLTQKDMQYIQDVVQGVFREREQIDRCISEHAKGWRIGRISKVCIAVMRVCLYEMLCRDDIPVSVSISEALELVEKYEGPGAKPFVNGILGAVSKDMEKTGPAEKPDPEGKSTPAESTVLLKETGQEE